MKTRLSHYTACVLLLAPLGLAASSKTQALYNSIPSHSVGQYLAFYELYPDTSEGKKALQNAWELLAGPQSTNPTYAPLELAEAHSTIGALIALVNKQPFETIGDLSESDITAIDSLGKRLANRKLKGHQAQTEEEVIALGPEEIDLARGLFLSQIGNGIEGWKQIRTYEALIDLMALQILSKIPSTATPQEKVSAISHFIFEEMDFRFPPHSVYAKDIDLYTFLPSVLDSRRGVCLGVSILYMCLAQRLDLSLQMITPPGHIYVRYWTPTEEINIETTARGIHLDSERYLGINTRSLQHRDVKEVIGLAHFNQASTFWTSSQYEKALQAYLTAYKYLPNDMLLKELMGYSYLMVGKKEEGEKLLKLLQGYIPDYAVSKDTLPEEYLQGQIDTEGLKIIFLHVDETRESLIKKKEALEAALKTHPQFHTGIFQLAITLLQLHKQSEALDLLIRYHELQPQDPTAEYYLTVLHSERLDFPHAWEHLHQVEKLVAERDHKPKALKELRKQLTMRCPEYKNITPKISLKTL